MQNLYSWADPVKFWFGNQFHVMSRSQMYLGASCDEPTTFSFGFVLFLLFFQKGGCAERKWGFFSLNKISIYTSRVFSKFIMEFSSWPSLQWTLLFHVLPHLLEASISGRWWRILLHEVPWSSQFQGALSLMKDSEVCFSSSLIVLYITSV